MGPLGRGSKGGDVARWQAFLTGQGIWTNVDGDFGRLSEASTKTFQGRYGLDPTGVVDNATLGKAMTLGFAVLDEGGTDETGPNWPPPPDFTALDAARRQLTFGAFRYTPAPLPGNPENITVDGAWVRGNIVTVQAPQLAGIHGAPGSGRIQVHRLAADKFSALWKAWEDAGLLPLVLSWDGCWVPRFVRGSRTTLSNHSYGTAFDINARWNPLGVRPPLAGKQGSVRRLVGIANGLGWWWGGHWGMIGNSRVDGMHFEIAKP